MEPSITSTEQHSDGQAVRAGSEQADSMQRLTHTAIGGKPKDRNDNWATPSGEVRIIASELFGDKAFDVDVCADDKNFKAPIFFTTENDGLAQNWSKYGQRCWMNPPYSQVTAWMEKAYCQSLKGCFVACLVPASTETLWHRTAVNRILGDAHVITFMVNEHGWQVFRSYKGEVWFSPRRINFGDPTGAKRSGNTKGSTLFVFYPQDCACETEGHTDACY